jgi:hypothetical protein
MIYSDLLLMRVYATVDLFDPIFRQSGLISTLHDCISSVKRGVRIIVFVQLID